LAVKTEMTYTVSGGALNSTQSNPMVIPPCVGTISSTWVTGCRPCLADLGGGISASCTTGRTMDGYIMCCGSIRSCQSAGTCKLNTIASFPSLYLYPLCFSSIFTFL